MEEERQYPLVKGRKRTILLFPLFFHQDGIRSPRSPKETRQLEVDNAIEQVNCVHQKRLIEKPNAAPSRGVIVGQ
ncbi:Inositol hexakisphosphate and diphosphoinositol-pentakisphosphate kinase [Trichinella spiralis]|uniref:Inositol hexakisphosphate and diphosphoinositol-pentakisphosphate kinase n=1 Tax=Trichinella spiralis TaxID=6334 RepID=A0ABR3KX32_TRISP